MSIGHFPQAYKIYKNKSSKDVSLVTYSIFTAGCYIWLIYGIATNIWPVVLSFGVGVVGTTSVLFLILRYRYFRK